MTIQNQRGIASVVENKRSEVADPSDIDWLARNGTRLTHAALGLFESFYPGETRPAFEVLATVESWTYQQQHNEMRPVFLDVYCLW